MFLSRFSPSRIGLDIQPSALRFVQLKPTRQGYWIEQADTADLPPEKEGNHTTHPWDAIEAALAHWVQVYGLAGMSAVITLPGSRVRMQRMGLPASLSAADIELEIHAALQRDFPNLTDALAMDYVLDKTDDPDNHAVFFVAARQETVRECVRCVNAAGLQAKIVDIDFYAIARTLGVAWVTMETQALIWETHDTMTLIVFEAADILFYHAWQKEIAADALASLNHFLQRFHASHLGKRVQCLYYTGMKADFAQQFSQAHPLSVAEIKHLSPQQAFQFSDAVKPRFTIHKTWNYLAAYGAAMREVPKWSASI